MCNLLEELTINSVVRSLFAAKEEGDEPEDEIIAKIIGAPSAEELTEVQQRYMDKVKAQIAKARRTFCSILLHI
jgi:hypothetical protein